MRISFAPLSLDDVYQLADDEANGAIVMMSGTVRNKTAGKAVLCLEYQLMNLVAQEIFRQIAAAIRQNGPATNRIVIHHVIGQLNIPGNQCFGNLIGCPHRGEAFAACRYAIDTLKHNAPLWKKEFWADGSSKWVNLGDCEESDLEGKI